MCIYIYKEHYQNLVGPQTPKYSINKNKTRYLSYVYPDLEQWKVRIFCKIVDAENKDD